ncbi:MAG TPA: outer membrane beta-barrel protein [Candidatus Polarisedimenticolia bacterium]|nr:outer membrane beta-barrel protein [Candidatus Polarisedimenticolia bacterium]
MRCSIAKGVLVLAAVGTCLAGRAQAQNREAAWEVYPYLGDTMFGSAAVVPDIPGQGDNVQISLNDKLSFGFRFGYHFTKRHMIEYGVGGSATNGTATITDVTVPAPPALPTVVVKSTDFKADIITGQANYIYNFFLRRRDRVVGFLTAGIGIVNFSTFGQSSDPDLQTALTDLVGDENDFMFDYGAGLRFFGSGKSGLRLDARQVRYHSHSRGDQDFIEVTLGVTVILGGT